MISVHGEKKNCYFRKVGNHEYFIKYFYSKQRRKLFKTKMSNEKTYTDTRSMYVKCQ